MARNVNETEADEEGQGGNIMERDTFLGILADVSKDKGKVSKLTGDISAKLTRAENQYNLDKKAFSIIQWAKRQEPARLNTFLHHFDAYREYAELDATAGQDMFEGATGEAGETTHSENGLDATEQPPAEKRTRGRPKGSKNSPKAKKPGRKKKGEPEQQPEDDTSHSFGSSFGDAVPQPGMALHEESETAGQG